MSDSKTIDKEPAADASRSEMPTAPSDLDGPAHGWPTAPSNPEAVRPLTSEVGRVLAESSEPDAEPGAATDRRWCRRCSAYVRPTGRGMCERCGCFLKLNYVARRHPQNVLRRDQIRADLLATFPPANVLDRATVEQLATVLEALESMRPGTPEWQRMITASQSLAAMLKGETPAPDVGALDLSNVPEDELISRLRGFLEAACEARDAKHQASAPTPTPTTPTRAPTITRTPEPEPEPQCAYCHRAISKCVELKANRSEVHDVLHSEDPEHVERRRYAAHCEMIESMRRARRGY